MKHINIKAMFRDGKGGWGIPYKTKKGETRMCLQIMQNANRQKRRRTRSL